AIRSRVLDGGQAVGERSTAGRGNLGALDWGELGRQLRGPQMAQTKQTANNVQLGAAHIRPRDAYKDVPILKRPTWNNEVAAYFFFGGVSAGSALIGSLAEVFGGERRKELARTAHYVSFATLILCPPLLIADLGMP